MREQVHKLQLPKLEESLCRVLCSSVRLHARQDEWFIVQTPFMFADGDGYSLYLLPLAGDRFRLSDRGNTMMRLSYENDLDTFFTGRRQRLFIQSLKALDIEEDDGELYLECTRAELGKALFRLGQAITKVMDLEFLNRRHMTSTFYEKLRWFLYETVSEELIHEDYTHPKLKDAKLYPIDYCLKRNRGTPVFLFGIAAKEKAHKTEGTLQQLRLGELEFKNLNVLPSTKTLTPDEITRLRNAGGRNICYLEDPQRLKQTLLDLVA